MAANERGGNVPGETERPIRRSNGEGENSFPLFVRGEREHASIAICAGFVSGPVINNGRDESVNSRYIQLSLASTEKKM